MGRLNIVPLFTIMNIEMTYKYLKSSCGFIAIALILLSCSSDATKKKNVLVFPSPPSPPKIQYLTSISSSRDITGQRSGFERLFLGKRKSIPIKKPYGLSIFGGNIFVCDTQADAIEVIDLEAKDFYYFYPVGSGKLKKPMNCAVDADTVLYVVDVSRKDITAFSKDGNLVGKYGGEELIKPIDVFIHDDKVWVSDIDGHRIRVYDKETRELLFSFPETDDKEDEEFLHAPTNITLAKGKIYITDFLDFHVKIFDLKGNFLKTIGGLGQNLGQFSRPKGVAVDRDENLYVVDAAFDNVQIFDKDGRLLMFFGGTYIGPGYMWLPATIYIDYDNLDYFREYVDEKFNLKYLIFVTNQYGPDRISIYGFVDPK